MPVMDKVNSAIIGGGSVGAIAANSDKVHSVANSEAVREAVNFLHYPLFEIGGAFIAPNTLCTFAGIGIGLYGIYRSHKAKKDKRDKE